MLCGSLRSLSLFFLSFLVYGRVEIPFDLCDHLLSVGLFVNHLFRFLEVCLSIYQVLWIRGNLLLLCGLRLSFCFYQAIALFKRSQFEFTLELWNHDLDCQRVYLLCFVYIEGLYSILNLI